MLRPYNMTFFDGHVASLFDFDAASPGPRIWDLAYLAYRLAPLAEDAGIDLTVDERLARIDRLIESYGMPFQRAEILRTLAARLRDLATYTDERQEATGNPEFAIHAAMYRRDAAHAETLSRRA